MPRGPSGDSESNPWWTGRMPAGRPASDTPSAAQGGAPAEASAGRLCAGARRGSSEDGAFSPNRPVQKVCRQTRVFDCAFVMVMPRLPRVHNQCIINGLSPQYLSLDPRKCSRMRNVGKTRETSDRAGRMLIDTSDRLNPVHAQPRALSSPRHITHRAKKDYKLPSFFQCTGSPRRST